MKKVYKKLTEDQKARKIVFSSQLMPDNDPTIHEVHENDPEKNKTIERLKNDSFFNNSPWAYNLIRS